MDVERLTLYKWIESENLQETIKEARNSRLDFIESKLDEKIRLGDTTAIIFALKTLAKDRGYVERQELDHTTKGEKITPPIKWVDGDTTGK